jgi:hypothetical protein
MENIKRYYGRYKSLLVQAKVNTTIIKDKLLKVNKTIIKDKIHELYINF